METIRYKFLRLAKGLANVEGVLTQLAKDATMVSTAERHGREANVCHEASQLFLQLAIAWDRLHGKSPEAKEHDPHPETRPVRVIRTPLMQALAGCQLALQQEDERIKRLRGACMLRTGNPPFGACDHWPDGCVMCEIGPRKDGCIMRYNPDEIEKEEECPVNKEFDSCALCPLNPKGEIRASK